MTSRQTIRLILGIIAVIVIAIIIFRNKPETAEAPVTGKEDLIRVVSPTPNTVVKSPISISGEARGTWYFEASFPVRIYDANGKLLGQAPAQAEGEWMTENFVPFKMNLVFSTPTTPTGVLVLEKDNPSGLPENADELRIPVRFENFATNTRTISLYYYDPEKDKDTTGNILCSRKGLIPVQRDIPFTNTPIQDAIKTLISGDLTFTEKQSGITTEFPLQGFSLTAASLRNGVLTLSFTDPNNRTSGGSCRAQVLWSQIEETAKQFPGVTSVRFSPDTLFQP